jgi:hypothetical protein
MNYPLKIDPVLYNLLRDLLTTGVVEHDGKRIDFSPVQTITIADGTATLEPPAKVTIKYGLMRIKTTLSTMTAKPDGIKIEIDNSPVDMEIRPDE